MIAFISMLFGWSVDRVTLWAEEPKELNKIVFNKPKDWYF